MPRGVPKAGFRKRRNADGVYTPKVAERILNTPVYEPEVETPETDEEISARIGERFEILEALSLACINGAARAMIVSGPAGLGKSYGVEKVLRENDPNEINHTIVKGYVRATGLVKLLFQYREAGKTLVFDDADAIFFDDTSLALLKAVCDTTERRRVSWLSEGVLIDEETAMAIPRSFDFNGTIIFITNYDFDSMIERGHKLAPHLQALVSRSHYIDLAMKSTRDYLIRIHQVIEQGLLDNLTWHQKTDVVNFIDKNHGKLRELSLRMAIKLAGIRKSNPNNWEKMARITCCKN